MNHKYPVIAIVGPTASGKSVLAVELVQKFGGEVISADSRQVYKGMDVGSGKLEVGKRKGVKHHLLDVASPKRTFTVAQYQRLAQAALKNIVARGHLPIVCGGTHFYVQVLIKNLELPPVKPNPRLRQALEKLSTEKLFAELRRLDPKRTTKIDRHNRRRLIRAIEIAKSLKGEALPAGRQAFRIPEPGLETNYRWLILAPEITDEDLKENIRARLKKRLGQGLIAEVERLRKSGLSWKRLENFGLEYRFVAQFVQGKINKKEMVRAIETASWQFARRQKTWLRQLKPVWVKNQREAKKLVAKFVRPGLSNPKAWP